MDDGPWISTHEAARRLGVSVRQVYRLIDEGRLPAYRFTRRIQVRRPDVDTLADDLEDR